MKSHICEPNYCLRLLLVLLVVCMETLLRVSPERGSLNNNAGDYAFPVYDAVVRGPKGEMDWRLK